ncbi:DUF4304 domain-containing protein [Flavisolibacter tropicus]|uniref:DUF4304 domain-containing protein n=1 Tax=Flavisolibacter tropicus TaxID=1492898 RepID=A0A172TXJ0_9BACT|nr:DUF4304 domain-containing protein [Flavisolibacter tropicus]ANE51688.1 hypothetical protein SY85_15450 [Flavisolibacter tropicus]
MEASLLTGYKYIQNEVKAFLGSFGFKSYKTFILYRTTDNDLLQFLSFQKGASSLSNQMTINIVQKGLFAPGCSFDTLQPGNRIGQFAKTEKDKWWYCDDANKVQEGVAEIKYILYNSVLPFFEFSKESHNISELVTADKYAFIWYIPSTFVDKGYFFLKAGLYKEAIQWWENHQPSKVPKFKTIKNLISQEQYSEVNKILEENIRMARARLEI